MSDLKPITNDAGTKLAEYQNNLGFRNKLARAIWGLVWLILFRPSPRLFHGWRRFLLRCFGAKIGHGVKPGPGLKVWAPWNLEVGDFSWLADGVDCYCVARVTIGRNAVISQRSFLCTASHDFTNPGFPLVSAPISIEDSAWIAAEAFVGLGVTIAEGAVVGARACVFKDVPAWTVVGGNPARVLKIRTLNSTVSPMASREREQPE